MAAHGGRMACLIYAHENGAPWDGWTCNNAVARGHLDCLMYATVNHAPDAQSHAHLIQNYLDARKLRAVTVIKRWWKRMYYAPGRGTGYARAEECDSSRFQTRQI